MSDRPEVLPKGGSGTAPPKADATNPAFGPVTTSVLDVITHLLAAYGNISEIKGLYSEGDEPYELASTSVNSIYKSIETLNTVAAQLARKGV